MGQRSQIYISWDINDKNENNYQGLIARYYQWNYGYRMISRAFHLIDHLVDEYLPYKSFMFADPHYITKLERLCDTNFDMCDICIGTDIAKEIREDAYGYGKDNVKFLFDQDNNDGQLLIRVTDDGVKYAFVSYDSDPRPMSASEYLEWDLGDDWNKESEYHTQEEIDYTNKNIENLEKIATLMTQDEVREFMSADYSPFIFAEETARN